MLKKIMIGLFAVFAILILISAIMTSGTTLFLSSPNKDLVYELRIKNGHLEHAVRHGGAQILKWSPLKLTGDNVEIKEIKVEKANHAAHEYVVGGFTRGILLDVKIDNTRINFSFKNVPAGEFYEDIYINPEPNSALKNLKVKSTGKTYIGLTAPKAKGTCYVYCDIDSSPEKIDVKEDSLSLKYTHSYTVEEENSQLRSHFIYVVDDAEHFEKIEPHATGTLPAQQ